jgi:multisubunit Na+/H+ antiporter MnhB subunit
MTRSRNFLPLAGFAVCAIAFVSYFLVFARFPATRDVPWASWLLFALGLGMVGAGIARAFRQPERYRGRIAGPVFGVLSLAVAGLFVFMTLVMTRQLPASSGAPKVGDKAPELALPDPSGRTVRLAELLGPANGRPGSWVLLIFYRGYW